jgi:hypothetical protein
MTETEAKWAERIEQWKQSGQRATEFAEGQPYKASTLIWWSTELRRRAQGGESRGAAGKTRKIPMARVVTRARVDSTISAAGLIVEVSGARIALQRGFDAELLSQVVRALGEQR